MTAQLIQPKTCSRCKGTGLVNARVVHMGCPGTCFKCDGSGQVEGDKARLAQIKLGEAMAQDLAARRLAFRQACMAWDKANRTPMDARAKWGLDILELQQPHRAHKAMLSFEAGRLDVFQALVTWLVTEAKPTHPSNAAKRKGI